MLEWKFFSKALMWRNLYCILFKISPKCFDDLKLTIFFIFIWIFLFCSETPVVEKEVVEVDAPKVVDDQEEEKVTVENGNGKEEAEKPSETAENGTTESAEEVSSAEPSEVEAEAQNGDSSGKFYIFYVFLLFPYVDLKSRWESKFRAT